MIELLELAERCERATGPDRELDAEIACAVKFHGLRPARPDDFDGKFGYSAGNIKVDTGFLMAESYTHSIDAAMTLVPEGLHWCCQTDHEEAFVSVGKADSDARGIFYTDCKQGRAKTLALALCAAALKARHHTGAEDGR